MCEGCFDAKPTTAAVIAGKYGQFCRDCKTRMSRQAQAGSAAYERDRDRQAHEKDLIQPWDGHGHPNREFIRNYPDSAVDYFSKEELEQYG